MLASIVVRNSSNVFVQSVLLSARTGIVHVATCQHLVLVSPRVRMREPLNQVASRQCYATWWDVGVLSDESWSEVHDLLA